jgi:hypothetical protein
MEEDQFSSTWERNKEALRKQHPHLTEDDLAYQLGKEEELLERLQTKLGKTKKEIRDWLRIMG